ncbi:hypothetical protein PFDG_01818 [Plasmodium falciparum Dd2]|uniref:Uncharacterized protein n=1 Tax=Plasmodium falciparum (isolate Dd2) TaxID=57267 RepID=A0A0L7M0B6_PLAF4|nr:hypothetical protein PFDG_01818 [Plasmodium falciparum Dd2]
MKKKYVFLTKEINVFKYVTINDEIRKYILRCTSFNNNGCNNQFIKKLHFYHTYVPTFYSYLKKLEIKKKCHIYNENNNIVIYKRLICIHKNKKEYHVNINEVPINNEDGKDNKVNIKENNKMYRNSKDHIHKKKNHVKINYNKILIQTNEQHKKSKIEDKWNENSHVREDEIYLHVNNLCKKIYYLSKNKIKDENLWKHYLIQYYKENKNYDHIKIKNIFMLLLGITNSNKHIKDMIIVINDEEKINEKGKKKKNIKIIEIVYNHLDILSKKINQMTNNQLSIFLYILEKWNMIDNYKDITNEIIFKILNQTRFKKKLFEKIATHIMMHTNNSSTDNNKSTPKTQIILKGKDIEINNNPTLRNHKNNDFFENDDKYTINNKMVDQTNNNTFNIFQITNIINSCLKCNYVNYDFFSYLLKQGNLFMDNSEPLDNLINVLNCVSNILKHFNVFKYKLYFHYEKKEKNQWQQENWLVHNDLTCSGKNHENSRNKIANWQNKIEHNNLDNKNNNMDFNNMMTSPLYYYYYYYDNDPSKGYCNLFEILYGYNSGYNLYTSFSSLSYVVKYNEQMFLKKFKDSKQSEVPHNFEIHLDNISDKILKIIEQNLNHENMKYIIHNLMISLSLCDIKYLNLYALCFFILKENYYYLSIDNLYLYLEILHRMKIYNHDIFYSIMEYINTHVHALESQKKMKIFLLSYNIFQKMDNPVDMKEMCDFFLSSNNKIEKENGNDDLMLGKCTHEKNLWKLPTDIEIKQNLINLENFQKELLSNNDNDKMEFHDNNCNIIGHDKFFSNNDENRLKKKNILI